MAAVVKADVAKAAEPQDEFLDRWTSFRRADDEDVVRPSRSYHGAMTDHSESTNRPAGAARLVDEIVASVFADPGTHRSASSPIPDVAMAEALVERFRWLAFPGFFGPRMGEAAQLEAGVRAILAESSHLLRPQIERALSHACPVDAVSSVEDVMQRFLGAIPQVRRTLASDARAGLAGDPAVHTLEEAVLSHPGLQAMIVHRFAHELHAAQVPLLPRMLAEIAHARTGIDIHPGAKIGEAFFIDHGTGVVIGETTEIGDRCQIYQGVTLGARRFERLEDGALRRDYKRHPSLGHDVTVYAGATILGGDTVIGDGSIVSGGVFLTESVPAGSMVSGPTLDIRLRPR